MAIVTQVTTIHASLEEVFGYLCNIKSWPEWTLNMIAIYPHSVDKLYVDASFTVVTRFGRQVIAIPYTVIDYQSCQRVSFIGGVGAISLKRTFSLTSISGGTCFTEATEIFSQGIWKISLPFIALASKHQANINHRWLKFCMEHQNNVNSLPNQGGME